MGEHGPAEWLWGKLDQILNADAGGGEGDGSDYVREVLKVIELSSAPSPSGPKHEARIDLIKVTEPGSVSIASPPRTNISVPTPQDYYLTSFNASVTILAIVGYVTVKKSCWTMAAS